MNSKRRIPFFILFIAGLLFFLFSCKKDFNPRDEYKDITLVYGLINPVDTLHYIRIHKAFLGPESVIVMAKEPDSSLYPVEDLDVRIFEINQRTGNRMPLNVRDTIVVGRKDTTGYFYAPDQRAYYFEKIFEKNSIGEYRPENDKIINIGIEVENKKTGKIVYAETTLVNSFNVKKPMKGTILDLDPEQVSSKFEWTNAKNGRMYDVHYTMRYREGRNAEPTNNYDTKTLNWHVGTHFAARTGNGTNQEEIFRFNPGAFYAQILRDVPYDTSVWRSPYVDVTLSIWCGSEDFYYYYNINRPQGLAQERPEYTNLKTKRYSEELGDYEELEGEAFGLFSSRIAQYIPIQLSTKMTMEYLPKTDRQFKGVVYQD